MIRTEPIFPLRPARLKLGEHRHRREFPRQLRNLCLVVFKVPDKDRPTHLYRSISVSNKSPKGSDIWNATDERLTG